MHRGMTVAFTNYAHSRGVREECGGGGGGGDGHFSPRGPWEQGRSKGLKGGWLKGEGYMHCPKDN